MPTTTARPSARPRRGSPKPAVVLALVLVLVVSGCEWALPNHSADGTRHNRTERSVGVEDVGSFVRQWVAATPDVEGTPVVTNNTVVVSTGGRLAAFRADGSEGCTGTPTVCQPLWVSAPTTVTLGQPYLIDGYVWSFASDDHLRIYELAVGDRCSGSPTMCEPAGEVTTYALDRLTVADGAIYLYGEQRVELMDRWFLRRCALDDVPCEPLWTFYPEWPSDPAQRRVVDEIAVVGRSVYLAESTHGPGPSVTSRVFALVPQLLEGCGGPHVECTPLWQSDPLPGGIGALAVDDGFAVVTRDGSTTTPSGVQAYSIAACSSSAAPCDPTWSAPLAGSSSLAVADGVVFAFDQFHGSRVVRAFDLDGVDGCGGVPRSCSPRFTLAERGGVGGSTAAIGNGVLYVGASAYDATGVTGCAGVPVVCSPLKTGRGTSEPIIANGRVHRVERSGGRSTLVAEGVGS